MAITETGISDHHNLTSFFRLHFEWIPPTKVEYRNYKKFDVTNFLRDLDWEIIQYSTFSDAFRSVLDRDAPLKRKMIRGNQGSFITKQLIKAIMDLN